LNNAKGAKIDMTDGRVYISDGTFTNDGLVVSTKSDSPGVLTDDNGTSVNNGFVDWKGNYNVFSWGQGSITDNGIVLTNTEATVNTTDDGDNDYCTADIAEVDYSWTDGTNTYQATSTGQVTFTPSNSSTLQLTTSYGNEVKITVEDVCTINPLTLIDFKVNSINNANIIYWKTTHERNVEYFEIQKSYDSRNFFPLIKIKAKNIKSTINNYQYIDKENIEVTCFYKLITYDYNGQFTASDIIAVYKKQKNTVEIFPTLLDGNNNSVLNIFCNDGNNTVIIYNMSGKQMLKRNFTASELTINVSGYKPGMYFVKLFSQGKIYAKKFLIAQEGGF